MNIHFIILHLYLMHFLCVSVIFHSRKKCLKSNLCFVILVVSCLRAGTASHASWVGGGGTKCATCPAGQEPGGWSSGPVQ